MHGHSGIRLSTQIKITETLDSEVEALKVEPCRWNHARRSGGAPVTMVRSAHTGLAPGLGDRCKSQEEQQERKFDRGGRQGSLDTGPVRRRVCAVGAAALWIGAGGGYLLLEAIAAGGFRPPITSPTIGPFSRTLRPARQRPHTGTNPVDWAGTKCLHRLHRLVQLGSHRRPPMTRKGLSHQGIRQPFHLGFTLERRRRVAAERGIINPRLNVARLNEVFVLDRIGSSHARRRSGVA